MTIDGYMKNYAKYPIDQQIIFAIGCAQNNTTPQEIFQLLDRVVKAIVEDGMEIPDFLK